MSSASLAVSTRPHPDSARIAAISAALALNLAFLLIASRPIAHLTMSLLRPHDPVQTIRLIDPPAAPRPPEPIVLKPLPQAVVAPQPKSLPLHLPSPVMPIAASPDTTSPVSVPASPAQPVAAPASIATAPVEASLAYRSAPLQFPLQALRQQMHGTVMLRVLVDETGKPVEVTVERGSGYALLDRSAREQVLAAWRFQPAMVNGHAVRAWARVPVSFDLHQG